MAASSVFTGPFHIRVDGRMYDFENEAWYATVSWVKEAKQVQKELAAMSTAGLETKKIQDLGDKILGARIVGNAVVHRASGMIAEMLALEQYRGLAPFFVLSDEASTGVPDIDRVLTAEENPTMRIGKYRFQFATKLDRDRALTYKAIVDFSKLLAEAQAAYTPILERYKTVDDAATDKAQRRHQEYIFRLKNMLSITKTRFGYIYRTMDDVYNRVAEMPHRDGVYHIDPLFRGDL